MARALANLSLDDSYVIVAAVDFGTTFSGYAFSFKSAPNDIKMNKSWGQNVGFQSYKTPTCVLVNSSNQFVAFGFEAEDKYAEQVEDDDSDDSDGESYQQNVGESFHLYRHFKMMLHNNEKITRSSTISSVAGKITPAMDIFVMALRYLKDHLISAVSQQTTSKPDESLFRWVITVPAIWRESAKQFMREAAYKAGYITNKDSRKLIIALEPEAASVYCRSLDINSFLGDPNMSKQTSFKTGTRYLVIDAGGGTIDLTAHEVLFNGKVKEIHRANGGDWGGTKVDQNFVKLLEDVLGKNFIRSFQQQCPRQWFRFMVTFEKVKRQAIPDDKSKITIDIPYSLSSKFVEICGKPINKAIKARGMEGVSFSNGLLVLKHNVVTSLFDPVTENVITHLKKIMKQPALSKCTYFLMVGGFSESRLLQDSIKKNFERNATVLVPEEAQMSVIKGAVLFGHSPDGVQVRIARKTYGVTVSEDFDESIHPSHRKKVIGGIDLCTGIFDKFVLKDSQISVGEPVSKTYNPANPEATYINIQVFASDYPADYVNEAGVEKIGYLTLEMPNVDFGQNRDIQADMTFGGTEIQVKATDLSSGETAETDIDFLS